MSADKKNNFLEMQLKTLGQKIRIDILKKLKYGKDPFSYSKLQKEVLEDNYSSVNFSFHLNALKKCDLIDSSEDGYYITKLGKQILKTVLSIERILIDRSKKKMIRTSKYSKELFDSSKIEEYLVTEGELDVFLAKQIAREVEERLIKTNIEYLTAPLMREYINAILLENGLEEVRHKLTRLGTPPHEAFKLFKSDNSFITPEKFIERLGSDVSEQFLLLNLLPKKLADLYLTGEIALLHLNYWSLRPLSIYLNTDSVLNYIFNSNRKITHTFNTNQNYLRLISDFCNFIYKLKQYYSRDLILGNFHNLFLADFELSEKKSYIMDIITSQLIRFEERQSDRYPHLTLAFNRNRSSNKESIFEEHSIQQFFSSLIEKSQKINIPLLLLKYSDFLEINSNRNLVNNIMSHPLKNNIILQNNEYSNLLNSTIIKIINPKQNNIILDKILINLHKISIDAHQSDDKFFDSLKDKLESTIEFFRIKEKLVIKKLKRIKEWNKLISQLFRNKAQDALENSIKSVSFFGLNKAVQNHCGIELDRTETSTRFALNVISFMSDFIRDKNESENNFYILTQPHSDNYLKDCWYNGASFKGENIKSYSSKIIRENSNLPLAKKISLFKRFEKLLSGGSIFGQKINACNVSLEKYLTILLDSKITAFSLSKFENN